MYDAAKDPYCYPENIEKQLRRLFSVLKKKRFLRGLTQKKFAEEAAHFLAELNAIHAFRDGNGRTQLAFAAMLSDHADHPLDVTKLKPVKFLNAMVAGFFGDEKPLITELNRLM